MNYLEIYFYNSKCLEIFKIKIICLIFSLVVLSEFLLECIFLLPEVSPLEVLLVMFSFSEFSILLTVQILLVVPLMKSSFADYSILGWCLLSMLWKYFLFFFLKFVICLNQGYTPRDIASPSLEETFLSFSVCLFLWISSYEYDATKCGVGKRWEVADHCTAFPVKKE